MQQAKVIKDSLDVEVGIYCGSSNRLKGHHDWEKELEQHEVCCFNLTKGIFVISTSKFLTLDLDNVQVFVMTPQILLHNLSHCFIRIEHIALLIFDECHYAQVESNHPYAEIMKVIINYRFLDVPLSCFEYILVNAFDSFFFFLK